MARKKNVHDTLAVAADALLLDIIQNGREVVTKDGEVVRVKATAADLTVAFRRLKDVGKSDKSPATDELGQAMGKFVPKFTGVPDLELDTPDEATGT